MPPSIKNIWQLLRIVTFSVGILGSFVAFPGLVIWIYLSTYSEVTTVVNIHAVWIVDTVLLSVNGVLYGAWVYIQYIKKGKVIG